MFSEVYTFIGISLQLWLWIVLIVLVILFFISFFLSLKVGFPDWLSAILLVGFGAICGAIIGLGFQNNNMKQSQDTLQSLMSIILKK